MKQSEKAEWVAALRGEYNDLQGIGRLRDIDDTYCCLGVYGDLRVKSGKAQWVETDKALGLYDWCFVDKVTESCALSSRLPDNFLSIDIQSTLMAMNDSGDYDFSQIADWIEENVEVED